MKLSEVFRLFVGPVKIVKVKDEGSGMVLEGDFEAPSYLQLNEEQQLLVESLIIHGGNLKKVGEDVGLSYPTLKQRLAEISKYYKRTSERLNKRRQELMDAVARGELSAEDALAKIGEM